MLPSLIFFWLRLGMAVKHGWLFNSLAAVDLLTQFLVRVVINLAFVSPLSNTSSAFPCAALVSCSLCPLACSRQRAGNRVNSHDRPPPVPSACCTGGYCIWENAFGLSCSLHVLGVGIKQLCSSYSSTTNRSIHLRAKNFIPTLTLVLIQYLLQRY